MQFAEIVGNNAVKQHLVQLVHTNRIPHASLFAARDGSGGLPMAMAFAQFLFCKQRTATDSCGTCDACAKVNNLVHPDLLLSFPIINDASKEAPLSKYFLKEYKDFISNNLYGTGSNWLQSLLSSKEKNKQGNITAKEVAEILQSLTFFSVEGGIRILLMWLPEYLHKEGNKLLKLIEEPPSDTIFLFVTERIDEILGTIKSRTQLVQLQPISEQEIYQALLQKGLSEKNAAQVARMAEGNFDTALQLANGDTDDNFSNLKQWLNLLLTNDASGLMAWCEAQTEYTREGQKEFLIYFMNMIEHMLRVQYMDVNNILLDAEELTMIQKMIKIKIDSRKAEDLTRLLNEAHYHLERNVNAKIVFTGLSLQLKSVFKGNPLYL